MGYDVNNVRQKRYIYIQNMQNDILQCHAGKYADIYSEKRMCSYLQKGTNFRKRSIRLYSISPCRLVYHVFRAEWMIAAFYGRRIYEILSF